MSISDFTKTIRETMVKSIYELVHTCLPGEIVSYDSGSGTASVKPFGYIMLEDETKLDMPIINSIPVYFPSAQDRSLFIHFPLQPGDGVIVLFSERSIDDWAKGGSTTDPRQFDISDAICIPGLWNTGFENDFPDDLAVRYKNTQLIIQPDSRIIIHSNLEVKENVEISGDLTVKKDVNTEGSMSIGGSLTVAKGISVFGGISSENDIEIDGNVIMKKNLKVMGKLEVEGDVAFKGKLEIKGPLLVDGAPVP